MKGPYVVWLPVFEAEGWSPRQEKGVGETGIRKVGEEHQEYIHFNYNPLHNGQ